MAQISIIVPIYNVERYLRRCLDSLLAQTFTDFEVLLVNDGSTDSSASICDEYTDKDRRFKLINQDNGGLSAARNTGIEHTRGDFVAFIDSDDAVAPTMLEVLLRLSLDNEADMAVCSINNVVGEKVTPQYPTRETFVCDGQVALRLTLEGKKIPGSICCKLLRRSVLGQVRFPVGLTYEDAYFIMEITSHLNIVAVTTEPLYFYHHRAESITTVDFNPKALDVITVYTFVLEQVKARYPDLLPQALFRFYWAHFTVLDRMLPLSGHRKLETYSQVRDLLKRNTLSILRNPYFQTTRKIAAYALRVNVRLYSLLLKIQFARTGSLS